MKVEHVGAKRLMSVDDEKLKFVGKCMDHILELAQETLDTTSTNILIWLRSPQHSVPGNQPFYVPQETLETVYFLHYTHRSP